MEKQLLKHIEQLHAFDNERRAWLILSSFVVFTVLGVIFEWDKIIHTRGIWLIVSAGFIVSVTWWYWTMRLVRHLIRSKHEEYSLLSEIVQMVREVKQDVKDLGSQEVDKSK